jgi:beta-glucosidase
MHMTFAPMLDVSRDPRWGRIAESPGEDPWLASRFAEAKVRGFQQHGLAATAKHFAAYGAVTAGREYASVDISGRTLHEVYLPPFQAAAEAGAAAVMPAFTDLAGVPMTAHIPLLRDTLRGQWQFSGVIISDFNAIAELITHGVAADLPEAAALALNAGVDIDMASRAYPEGLAAALERGLVTLEQIDAAVRRVLTLKARLGLFAPPVERPALTEAQWAAHRALARDAARRSMVLLQNRGGLLPLSTPSGHAAIIGPHAQARQDVLGPWAAEGAASEVITYADGLRAALPGWRITETDDPRAAAQADVILLCIGEDAEMCGEAASRVYPGIPDEQRRLAEDVLSLGKPVIAILTCGRPLTASWLFDKADAVLAAWFPGSQAGRALADVLTGKWNPSGRLPVSWPRETGQIPVFYAQRPTGRPHDAAVRNTSKYIDCPVEPQFPFGFGLNYSQFAYSNLRVAPAGVQPGTALRAEMDIINEGAAAGEVTVLLFIRAARSAIAQPVMELRGTAKLTLAPGERGRVHFDLTEKDWQILDASLSPQTGNGPAAVFAGPSAAAADLLVINLNGRA